MIKYKLLPPVLSLALYLVISPFVLANGDSPLFWEVRHTPNATLSVLDKENKLKPISTAFSNGRVIIPRNMFPSEKRFHLLVHPKTI